MDNLDRAFPLLLVKPFAAQGPFRISSQHVSLADLPATVMSALGEEHSYSRPSFFVEGERPARRFSDYSWKHEYWVSNHLPSMQEYRIEGPARDPASWTKTRLLHAGSAQPELQE